MRRAPALRLLAPMLALLLLLPLIPPAGAQADGADFTLRLQRGVPAVIEAVPGVRVIQVREVPGEVLEFNVSASQERVVGRVLLGNAFDVQRGKQVRPEVVNKTGDHFLAEVFRPEGVHEAAAWARVANVSQGPSGLELRVAFPMDGAPALFRLVRDVAPPNFTVGRVQNLTHIGFYLESETEEYAYADLQIRRLPDGEPVRNPTTVPALLQRFPVQGLTGSRDYEFWVEFADWSGNTVISSTFPLRTPPTPVLPAPTITGHWPPANATLKEPVRVVWVNFTGGQPTSVERVAVFLDKVPQHGTVTLAEGRVEARPAAPMGPGRHSVGVEITGPEGGLAVARWSFTVEGATPLPAEVALGALGLAALAAARRRR